MTELRHFLTSLFDAVSEAEMQALVNGRTRLERMVESGRFPEDVSLPVYHANELSVSLDVGLEARRTKGGIQLFVTEPGEGDDTALEFDLEVYDFLETDDLRKGGRDHGKPDHRAIDVHVPLRDSPAGVESGIDPDDPTDPNDPEKPTDSKEAYYREREREREGREETDDDRSDRTGDELPPGETETETGGKETDVRDRRPADESNRTHEREDGKPGKREAPPSGSDEKRGPESGRSRRPFLGIDLPEGWPLRRAGGTEDDDETEGSR